MAEDSGMALDASVAMCAGHQSPGGRSFRKQRTVNPLMASTRYNFLYPSSRPALRAADGRPPARQRHDGHRGAGLTLSAKGNQSNPTTLAWHLALCGASRNSIRRGVPNSLRGAPQNSLAGKASSREGDKLLLILAVPRY